MILVYILPILCISKVFKSWNLYSHLVVIAFLVVFFFFLIVLKCHKSKCDIGILLFYYLKNIMYTEVAVRYRQFPGSYSVETG